MQDATPRLTRTQVAERAHSMLAEIILILREWGGKRMLTAVESVRVGRLCHEYRELYRLHVPKVNALPDAVSNRVLNAVNSGSLSVPLVKQVCKKWIPMDADGEKMLAAALVGLDFAADELREYLAPKVSCDAVSTHSANTKSTLAARQMAAENVNSKSSGDTAGGHEKKKNRILDQVAKMCGRDFCQSRKEGDNRKLKTFVRDWFLPRTDSDKWEATYKRLSATRPDWDADFHKAKSAKMPVK